MTLDEASKIVYIWGAYTEHMTGKLLKLFMVSIPELLLPFPKKTLEEAIDIMAEYHHNGGKQDMVKALEASKASLLMFTGDEEAIAKAVKFWSSPSWRAAIQRTNESHLSQSKGDV